MTGARSRRHAVLWLRDNEDALWYVFDSMRSFIDSTGRGILRHLTFFDFCEWVLKQSDLNGVMFNAGSDPDTATFSPLNEE